MLRFLVIFMAISFAFLTCNTLVPSALADTEEEGLSHKSEKAVPDKKEIQELEKLRGDFMQWFNVQKEKRSSQYQGMLEMKIFQTNIFFGGLAAFFTILAALFILKLIYNIVRDSIKAVYEKIMQMMGRDTANVREHYFAPVMKDNSGKVVVASSAGKTSSARPVQAKKKFLFGDVMLQFVNPLITPQTFQKALADQNTRDPKPKIGAVLIEFQAASQKDVDKTLRMQQQFRAQK